MLIAGHQGARRFSEYRRYAEGISDRVLTQRLRELEQHGLLDRTVVPTMPVQVTYTPTPRGIDLVRSLQPLIAWFAEVDGVLSPGRDRQKAPASSHDRRSS